MFERFGRLAVSRTAELGPPRFRGRHPTPEAAELTPRKLRPLRLIAVEPDTPHLSVMQHTENTNPIGRHDVGCHVRRTRDKKLPSSGNPARATAFGKIEKPVYSADDLFVAWIATRGFSFFEHGTGSSRADSVRE